MRGKALVEQVDREGNIVIDYDTSLTVPALLNRIKRYFPAAYLDSDGMICGEYGNHQYAIRTKNITYLGNPHPEFKKRIQIPDDLQKFYNAAISKNKRPILLGVYTYEDAELFCDFNIEDYIDKKAHNSSAHVYTSDLANAMIDGIFQKIDYFGNKITVFRPDMTEVFLNDLFVREQSAEMQYFSSLFDKSDNISYSNQPLEEKDLLYDAVPINSSKKSIPILSYTSRLMPEEVVDEIKTFFESEDKVWYGIDCYEKMIADNYRNKFQPEWAGFFLEYEFESYINDHALTRLVTYAQDKTLGGIDLDLYFPTIECYGDLKAHSDHSRGIQGNDWDTVFSIIDSNKVNNHIFYIVCEHSTVKDSDCGYEVTQYWNRVQNKANLMSYSKRMKNRVELKKIYILDINSTNKQYLTMFKQGVNSNGQLRAPKIMIEHDKLDKFVIFEMDLS